MTWYYDSVSLYSFWHDRTLRLVYVLPRKWTDLVLLAFSVAFMNIRFAGATPWCITTSPLPASCICCSVPGWCTSICFMARVFMVVPVCVTHVQLSSYMLHPHLHLSISLLLYHQKKSHIFLFSSFIFSSSHPSFYPLLFSHSVTSSHPLLPPISVSLSPFIFCSKGIHSVFQKIKNSLSLPLCLTLPPTLVLLSTLLSGCLREMLRQTFPSQRSNRGDINVCYSACWPLHLNLHIFELPDTEYRIFFLFVFLHMLTKSHAGETTICFENCEGV